MPRKRTADVTRKRGKRRDEIIQAAARLFREFGFKGTSIVDIAEAVDLPKSGIYNYVESKEELLYEIITRSIRQFAPILREIKASHDTPQSKFRQAVYHMVFQLASYPGFVPLFSQDRKALSKEHHKEYDNYGLEVREFFEKVLSQGMKKGVFRKTDVRILTLAVIAMCRSVNEWYRPDGRLTPEEIALFFTDTAEHLVSS